MDESEARHRRERQRIANEAAAKAPKQKQDRGERVPDSPAVAAAKAALKAARQAERPARVAKPKAEPRPTCGAKKANGEPCTAKAKASSATCVDHQPAWARLTVEQQAGFSAWVVGLADQPNGFNAALANELGWHRAKALSALAGQAGVARA